MQQMPPLLRAGTHRAPFPGQIVDVRSLSADYCNQHSAQDFQNFVNLLQVIAVELRAFDKTSEGNALVAALNRTGVTFADKSRSGVGELLAFFFFFGAALGEDSGEGVGDDFFFFGEGDFSGVAVGFGVGDCSAVDFFFVCLCGVGVGGGAKTFFSFVPNDSAAGVCTAKPATAAMAATATAALILRRMGELLLRQLSEHRFVQADAAVQILEREIFVRRMGPAIGQRQSHQKRFDSENITELGDDGNAAAFTDDGRIFSKSFP
jgi:hypothetical protein